MILSDVIGELRARCPSFADPAGGPARVGGAAQFRILPEAANLVVPAAYVLPLDENAGAVESESEYLQYSDDGFAVVVVLSNVADERGQAAANDVHSKRAEIWKAILGFVIGDYYPIKYGGGQVIHLDRARLYYQFEFSAKFVIDKDDTRQGVDVAAAPTFTKLHVELGIDASDPSQDPVFEVNPSQD